MDTGIAKHVSQLTDVLKNIPALRPEDVADALIYALGSRPEVQVRTIYDFLIRDRVIFANALPRYSENVFLMEF